MSGPKPAKVGDGHRLEALSREECLLLLASEQVARVGVVEGSVAHVVPVNFALDGDAIVFRSSVGTKLYAAGRAPVTVEVDRIDRTTRSGWSVVARGIAQEITDADRSDVHQRLWGLGLEPWAPGDRPHLVRVPTETLTGRRLLCQDPPVVASPD